jgi:hypothetical protein
VLTGHSLGRNKLDHLLRSGTVSRKQIEETYAISRRIEGEERALDTAQMVITSTQQEVDLQWGLYDGYNADMAAALHYRRATGRAMPVMNVIPPGLDFSSLKVCSCIRMHGRTLHPRCNLMPTRMHSCPVTRVLRSQTPAHTHARMRAI